MADKKHIDDLVARREIREAELREIGNEIRKSGRAAAVAFIDLSDSTALKESSEPEIWLGNVYRFIRSVENCVRQFDGAVVKRIGDEVLATFESVSQCEQFLDALQKDEVLRSYSFKAAADYGEVFFLKFLEHLEDDPYGSPVDRCARIAKLARAGVIVCSGRYQEELGERANHYIRFGPFKLPGIAEPQEVYVRRQERVDNSEAYLKPLLDALNDPSMDRPHYHSVARQFSAKDFDVTERAGGRPFLLRELLNVPKLSLCLTKFLETLKELDYKDEASNYVGYLVEWEGVFHSAKLWFGELTVTVRPARDSSDLVMLQMPLVMTDLMRRIQEGSEIRFRGVIIKILMGDTPVLDYVDIDTTHR
jgi:class 3 adenylate cyclase